MSYTAAQTRATYLTGLLWHLGAFAIINAFFWILDLMLGESGIQWAFWITLVWGMGLAFHVLAWAIAGRQVARRMAQKYAAEDAGHEARRG